MDNTVPLTKHYDFMVYFEKDEKQPDTFNLKMYDEGSRFYTGEFTREELQKVVEGLQALLEG